MFVCVLGQHSGLHALGNAAGGHLFEIFVVFFLKQLSRALGVEEELVDLLDLVASDLLLAVDARQDVGWREQLDGVA